MPFNQDGMVIKFITIHAPDSVTRKGTANPDTLKITLVAGADVTGDWKNNKSGR
jgi:hypothetical protein